jgi:hypothetical protein
MICAILIFLRFCGIFRGVILIVGFFVCFQGKEHRDGDERTVLEQTVFGMFFAKLTQIDTERDEGCDEQEGEHRGNTDRTDHQRVGAKQLNKRSAESVPYKIPDGNLAMVFAFTVKDIDEDETDKVPEGFIEERGVDVEHLVIGFDIAKAHTPRERGFCAEGFTVAEITPSADGLSNEEAQRHHVQHSADGKLLDFKINDL